MPALPDSVRRRISPDERYGLRVTLLVLALVLLAVPFALLTYQVVREGPLLAFDTRVTESARAWMRERPEWVRQGVRLVSDLGKPVFLTLLAGATAFYAIYRDRIRLAVFVVATTTAGGLVNSAVKVLVARPRPDLDAAFADAAGKSFPSGHAMSSTVVYGVLLLVLLPLVPRRGRGYAAAGAVALVLAVAASRVALGVHYLSDVVAGLVLGLAWLSVCVAAFRVWRAERGVAPEPVLEGVEPELAE